MCSVAVFINYVAVAIDKVIAVNVVYVPVMVIITTVACDFIRVGPDIGSDVRMPVIDTCIDYRYYDIVRAGGYVPCRDGVDVGVYDAARLACIFHRPEPCKVCIVGHTQSPYLVVWFHANNAGVFFGFLLGDCLFDGFTFGQFYAKHLVFDYF